MPGDGYEMKVRDLMNDSIFMVLKMATVGMALGTVFFGGLWMTLRRLPASTSPYLLVPLSGLIRTAVVVCGIWFFSNGDPLGIVCGLGGFVAMQAIAVRQGLVAPQDTHGDSVK